MSRLGTWWWGSPIRLPGEQPLEDWPGAAEPSALLPPPSDGQDPWETAQPELERLMAQFSQLERQLTLAARRDGLDDDGPMVPTLQALRLCMGTLRGLTAVMAKVPRAYAHELSDAVAAGRAAFAAETSQLLAGLDRSVTRAVHTAVSLAVKIIAETEVSPADGFSRKTILASAGAVLLFGFACYGWGSAASTNPTLALQQVQDTLQQIQQAMQPADDPSPATLPIDPYDAAAINFLLAACKSRPEILAGHKLCNFSFRLHAPTPAQRQHAAFVPTAPAPPLPPPQPQPPSPQPAKHRPLLDPLEGFPPSLAKGISHFGPARVVSPDVV